MDWKDRRERGEWLVIQARREVLDLRASKENLVLEAMMERKVHRDLTVRGDLLETTENKAKWVQWVHLVN